MPVLKYGLYHHTLTYKGHVRTYAASAVLCMLSMYAKEMEGEEKERGRGRKGEGGGEREVERERWHMYVRLWYANRSYDMLHLFVHTEKTFKGPKLILHTQTPAKTLPLDHTTMRHPPIEFPNQCQSTQ